MLTRDKLFQNMMTVLNKLSPLALLVLIITITWYFTSLLWLIIAPPKANKLPNIEIGQVEKNSRFNEDVFNLFKNSESEQSTQVVQQTMPVSNIKLEGVMLAEPAHHSSAILNTNSMSKRYRVNENIGDTGYRLKEVYWKKVVVEDSSGNIAEINLYESMDLNAAANLNTKSGETNHSFNGNLEMPSPLAQPIATQAPKKSIKEQVNDMLQSATNELKSNPAAYLNKMGVMSTGDGYVVTDNMNNQIRNNIGLQQGDKVISVNGQQVGQPNMDALLLEEIKRTGSAEIQVQRGSQVITIRQQF